MVPRHALLVAGCLAVCATVTVPAVAAATSSEALRIARESRSRWTIGAVRRHDGHGRTRAHADLVADGVVIARLRLDPSTGALVPDKRYADTLSVNDLARLQAEAIRALSHLEIAGWAWPAAHGHAWRIPLRSDGRVVGTVTVDVERGRLVGEHEREHIKGDDS
jgi:hypothetical protein